MAIPILAYFDRREETQRRRKTTPEGQYEHPAEIWLHTLERRDKRLKLLMRYKGASEEYVFDEVNEREDNRQEVIVRTQNVVDSESKQLATITERPLLVEDDTFLQYLDEAASDTLKEATRTAKRNLNGVWGIILFAALANNFRWPNDISVFSLSFKPGEGLTAALTLLVAYHGWQFWSYLYADTRVFRAAYDEVQRFLVDSKKVIELVPNQVQWPVEAEHLAWVAQSTANLEAARKRCRPARHRYFVDFKVPKYGALVTLAVLWGMQIHRWLNP